MIFIYPPTKYDRLFLFGNHVDLAVDQFFVFDVQPDLRNKQHNKKKKEPECCSFGPLHSCCLAETLS
jgi:hypothetical protein